MRLPSNTFAFLGDFPFCPWCHQPPNELAIPFEALLAHLNRGVDRWVSREDDGSTDADIVCDCPLCAKPFAVALHQNGVTLLAVTTEADRRLMAVAFQEGA